MSCESERESECPYEVRVSESLGRYLVASKDLGPRHLIISEDPIVEGPLDEDGDNLMCLGCCLKLTENQYSRCQKCRYPVCGPTCEKSAIHAENECRIFVENRVAFPPPYPRNLLYKSIIILRCLLLKQENREKWNQVMTMSDNWESRRNRPNCITADERILDNLRKFLPNSYFTEQEIYRLSGILDVNAHSFPVKVNGKVIASKCHIYMKTSLLSHSCCPNSSWSSTNESKNKLVIRTNIPVSKGEIISVAYDDTDLLYGTLRRLIPMEINWMFTCKCTRCLDKTEFGTFLSALKCQNCTVGYLLSLNPTNSFSDWKCESCGKIFEEVFISELIEEAESAVGFSRNDDVTEIDDVEDVAVLMQYAKEFSQTLLHPNHYILQQVNLRIIRALCYSLDQLEEEDLVDFLGRCKSLMRIADVLVPGFGEYRAFIQYHYFRALLVYQERLDEKEKKPPKEGLSTALDRYNLILKMQKEVLIFLEEKFINSPRIERVLQSIAFVEEKLKVLTGKEISSKENQTPRAIDRER